MSQADREYKKVIESILENGIWDTDQKVRARWADGAPAHTISWISQKMVFDNSEVPILTTKRVAWKTSIKEICWIWQSKSNRVQELRDMGVKIWNEWELPDGTIGSAYGYQLNKKNRKVPPNDNLESMIANGEVKPYFNQTDGIYYLDQVDYLLYQLKYNSASRRHIVMLWNPDDLDDMALTPCVYESQWIVKGGKLHLEVRCRSNDMALGNPLNIFQYNVLQRMIAQVTGYELGYFIYHIGDAHLYDRHVELIKEQINRHEYDAPKLWINPEVKSFYDFTIDDFKLIDYKHGEKIYFEVAI